MLDADRESRIRELFREALDLPPEKREAFLDGRCGSDPELRARLADLLAEEARGTAGVLAKGLFGKPSPEGERVGPYRLLEVLGEGGMGTVHLAEQTEPIRRKVALKTIRLGMASEEVLARFAGERQALARMNHPHIAEIYDAGTTDSGLPWFAMEYCPGPPLDRYADGAKLSLEERIGLLLPVCDAVQHAHQKGVIHRDLKPANILVPQSDGRPVPKIIDFGVARAVAGGSLAGARHTSLGAPIGTWLYMSPEQADPKADVDTGTDVWALGAILCELLTGTPPFPADDVTHLVVALAREDPVAPSRRLRALPPDRALAVAQARRTTPQALARHLTGDLDAIVLRALERDRARRYASASELAADLRRHLASETVSARAPTLSYQLARFVRRNRTAVTLFSAALLAVLLGLTAAWQSARRAQDAEHARRELAHRILDEGFARNEFLEHAFFVGGDLPLRALLEEAEGDIPALFGARPGEEAAVRTALGVAWLDLGDPGRARPHLERSYRLLSRTLGRESVDLFLTLDALIRAARQSDLAPESSVVDHALSLAVDLTRQEDAELGAALEAMVAMRGGGDPTPQEAEACLAAVSARFERAADRREMALFVGRVLVETAATLYAQGRLSETESYSRAVERLAEEIFERGSTQRLLFLWRFAELHLSKHPPMRGRAEEILARLLREIDEARLPPDHWLRHEALELQEKSRR
jgi:serine/threonine protein kinase